MNIVNYRFENSERERVIVFGIKAMLIFDSFLN